MWKVLIRFFGRRQNRDKDGPDRGGLDFNFITEALEPYGKLERYKRMLNRVSYPQTLTHEKQFLSSHLLRINAPSTPTPARNTPRIGIRFFSRRER